MSSSNREVLYAYSGEVIELISSIALIWRFLDGIFSGLKLLFIALFLTLHCLIIFAMLNLAQGQVT